MISISIIIIIIIIIIMIIMIIIIIIIIFFFFFVSARGQSRKGNTSEGARPAKPRSLAGSQ